MNLEHSLRSNLTLYATSSKMLLEIFIVHKNLSLSIKSTEKSTCQAILFHVHIHIWGFALFPFQKDYESFSSSALLQPNKILVRFAISISP